MDLIRQRITMKKVLVLLFVLMQCNTFYAQKKVLQVWPEGVPESILDRSYQEESRLKDEKLIGISKVVTPELSFYIPENSNGTAVLILPGGGYTQLAIEKEGFKIARWLNKFGITSIVLKYRLPNDKIMKHKEIGPLQDAQEAIRIIRGNAAEWSIDPSKIGVMGFSAGGHLAATLSTKFSMKTYEAENISARPDFAALIYPVISMKESITHPGSRNSLLGKKASEEMITSFSNELNVTVNTPPTFLVHASDDEKVPVENSIQYFQAARSFNIPAELHIYEKGGHGFGLGNMPTNEKWPEAFIAWLKSNNFLEEDSAYIFSYFKGNGEDGLHLAYSENGLEWNALNKDNSVLEPELGNENLMRDPNIIKGKDGIYHMVWTVGWTEKGIGYSSSKDLINWSKQELIPVMQHEEMARNCWAPEITYNNENDEFIIYWASTIKGRFLETQSLLEKEYNHRMYYTSTKDFENFSTTKLLYDPGFNIIDASIIEENNMYYMFLKDETREPEQKNIRVATSKNVTGPYHNLSNPITGDYWAEGPSMAKVGNYWYVYFDKYIDKKYGAVRSKDFENWEDVSGLVNFPDGARHGTVLSISKKELEELKCNF